MAELNFNDKNVIPSPLVCLKGLWQVYGRTIETPPADSGYYTSFYLKQDGKVWYGFNGTEYELKTGADLRFPQWKPGFPPVDGPDLIPGDFWDGQYLADPIAVQHAIKTGDPNLPFAVIRGQRVPYEGSGGATLNAPSITSAVYQSGTGIVLTFSFNNSTLSRVALYKSVAGGAFTSQDLSTLSTSYTDTSYTTGKDYQYYLVVYSGSLVSPQGNTVSVSVPINSQLLQFDVISPPGYANTIIKARINNPSNTNEPIKYNWAVYLGDYFAGGIYKASGFDSMGSEPGVGVLVLDLSRYNLVPGVVYRLYLQESNDPTADKRRNWVEFTLPEPNTVPAETDFSSASWVSGSVSTSDLKIHVRANGGRPPRTFVLKNLSGTVIETRAGSNKTEEIFSQNLTGYSWSITDADNKVSADSIDAVSFEAYTTPVRATTALFGQPSEQVAYFDSYGAVPGMNAVGGTFNAFEYMQERLPISEATRVARFNAKPDERCRWDSYTTAAWQGFDNALWDTEYDHTVAPSGGYAHPFDEIIRRAYTYKNAAPGRLGFKIGFWANRPACTLSDRYPEYDFAYSNAEGQKTKEGASHISAAKENQYLALVNSSFGSDNGRLYWAACLKKFCKRYRRAINDGTILTISFCMQNSGEEEPASTYSDSAGNEHLGYGDFAPVLRAKFAAWLSMWFNGNVATFNTSFQMGSRAITAFTASQFSGDLLYGGSKILQQHFTWFSMMQLAEFTAFIRKNTYENVSIDRKRFWTIDVGNWFDNQSWLRASRNFVQRVSIQPNILYIKNNGYPEGNDQWLIDQTDSIARQAGAVPVWEVSPADPTVWQNFLTGVKHCMEAGFGLSCFPAGNSSGLDPVQGWRNISDAVTTDTGVKMSTYSKFPERSTLDASGNPRRATVILKDFIMYLKPDPDGVVRPIWPVPNNYPREAWQALVTASGGLPCEIYVDFSSMFADYPPAA